MFKTKIVRLACKIPLSIVQFPSKRGTVTSIKDYKSKELKKFHESFSKTFLFVWRVLSDLQLVQGEPTDKHFIDFICLHFPSDKVCEIARVKGMEDIAKKQCQMRKRTSLWGY